MINTLFTHKHYALILIPLFLSILFSCSGNKNKVSLDGRILNMNQADFYVYSPDGVTDGIDTIHVQGGRFEFVKEITQEGTLVVVFPNYTQMPLFVAPGEGIDIEGDAQHLRELEVTGTDDNEAFTEWRKDNLSNSLVQQKANAEKFVKDNPTSPVSLWLLRQYYITTNTPDVAGAKELLKLIMKDAPDALGPKKLHTQLSMMEVTPKNGRLGHFSVTDINGKLVNEKDIQNGTTVILTVASWNFESQNMLRQLASRKRGESFFGNAKKPIDNIIALSMDADKRECKRVVRDCHADNVYMIWDGLQFESPLLKVFNLSTIPDNIELKDGKIEKHHVPIEKL